MKSLILHPHEIRQLHRAGRVLVVRPMVPQPSPATTHPDCAPSVTQVSAIDFSVSWMTPSDAIGGMLTHRDIHSPFRMKFQPGEARWVKETWRLSTADDCACYDSCRCKSGLPFYAAESMGEYMEHGPWRSAVHLPREFSRYTVRVVENRVLRVQGMSEDDCYSAGVSRELVGAQWGDWKSAEAVLRVLWGERYGRTYPWDSNPWVVATLCELEATHALP